MNKNLLQIHAKSFYWASFFLSKKIFYQCSVLYNFCRTLDDIVDSEEKLEIRKKKFSNFKNLTFFGTSQSKAGCFLLELILSIKFLNFQYYY